MIVSWDGDTTIADGSSTYDAYLMGDYLSNAPIQANIIGRQSARPLIGGVTLLEKTLTIEIIIKGSGTSAALRQKFDTSDGVPRTLIISDTNGTSRRFIQGLCTSFVAVESGLVYQATIQIDDDTFWRAETETAIAWSITGSPSTLAVNNPGKVKALPRFVIRPTVAKTVENPYKTFASVKWNSNRVASLYPVDITNAGLDTQTGSTNFSSATGDDIRVLVDGVEVDFWIDGPNTATTSLWANLNFAPKVDMTLDGAVSNTDTEIVVNENIAKLPPSGILQINSEIILYGSKNNEQKRFSSLTRGAKNSTAASHSDNDSTYWIQHDITITYGQSSPTAYPTDDNNQPIFTLSSSSNTSWVYQNFGEDDGLRTGAWQSTNLSAGSKYTANRATDADPWSEMGAQSTVNQSVGRNVNFIWSLYSPTGITAANFSNGEKYTVSPSRWSAYLRSSKNGATFTNEYTITAPSSASTWESWSNNVTGLSGVYYIYMWLLGQARSSTNHRLEVSDVTVTLDSAQTPTVSLFSESGNYSLNVTLTNETNGQAVLLSYQMALTNELEFDTKERTVIDLTNSSNQFHALTLLGGARADYFDLEPGDNTIKWEDTGTAGVTTEIYFRIRYGE